MKTTANISRVFSYPAWYCVRSQPKHEHIAAAHVRTLDRVTVFCPRIRFKRATRRGIVWAVDAMFPGYLFARFDLSEMHRLVRYSCGVSAIVRFGERYPIIDEGVIAELQKQTGATGVKEWDCVVREGDSVKVGEGVFTGLEAVVTQVLSAQERVKILLEFLGRQVEAIVDTSSLV
jgi:transcriptional antiterminator RfaH